MTGSHNGNDDTPLLLSKKVDDLHRSTMGTDRVVTSLLADWGMSQRQGSNLGFPCATVGRAAPPPPERGPLRRRMPGLPSERDGPHRRRGAPCARVEPRRRRTASERGEGGTGEEQPRSPAGRRSWPPPWGMDGQVRFEAAI
jgi:hypothetical protein